MKERVQFIDRLKGFAIIAVVFGHVTVWPLKSPDVVLGNLVASFHMPIFMFFSGLVISAIPTHKKCFDKVLTFLCPMITIGLLMAIVFHKPIGGFWFDNMKYGYWYLYVLSVFYLLLTTFSWRRRLRSSFGWDVIYGIGIFAILLGARFILPTNIGNFLSISLCSSYWPMFLLGFLARKYNLLDYLMGHNWIFTLSLVGYVIATGIYIQGYGHVFLICAVFAIPTFVYLFKQREKSETFVECELAHIGRHSLDVYIYHYFFVRSIYLSDIGLWISQTDNFLLGTTLIIIMSVLITYLSLLAGYVIKQSQGLSSIIYGSFIKKLKPTVE